MTEQNWFNGIIDLSHWNGEVDFEKVKKAGIEAVILKATQGIGPVDLKFYEYREKALAAGLKIGAYHFGIAESGAEQAKHFLDIVGFVPPEVNNLPRLILDFEQATLPMSAEQAREFLATVYIATGKWPMVYADPTHEKELAQDHATPNNSELWLAKYANSPDLNAADHGWATWKMWQYTDGVHGPNPHTVDGVAGHVDRSYFNGTKEEFEAWW